MNWSLALRKDQTMKRKRHTEEQIIAILKEHEAGMKTADLCRKYGISEASFYNWKTKYGGLEVSEAKRLRGLESENAKLKKLLADAKLDNAALKELLLCCCTVAGSGWCAAYGSGERFARASGRVRRDRAAGHHRHSPRRHGGRTERLPQWARVRGLARSGATAEFHRRQTSPGRDIQARQPIFAPASDQRRQR